jgi:ATP synthase protein I
VDTPKDKPAIVQADMGRQERAKILRVLLLQGLLTVMMAVAGWCFGAKAAASLLTGGLIGLLTSIWMALVLLRPSAGTPSGLVSAFYVGEIGKYLFVMAFFAIAFKKIVFVREPHNALLMLGAFAITQLVIWLWPLLTVNVDGRTENQS